MQTEIIISGFGGQGVLFAGMLLAYAGMDSGKNVTWIPSYGPEMRGGTAHVTVIISDTEIGSPIVGYPQGVMALNNPSVEKYETLIKPGGVMVYNSSLVTLPPQRADIQLVPVPANEIALALGEIKMANMATLGALVAATQILSLEAINKALQAHLPAKKRALLEANWQVLRQGAAIVQPELAFQRR